MTDKEKSLHACGFSAIAIILILGLTSLLSTCSSTKKATQTQLPIVPIENNSDTRVVHIETIDTVYIEIPAQSAERTTPDKYSHLETDYAESDARINADGTLTHTLKNKTETSKPIPVKNSTDTIYQDRYIEKPVEVQVPVKVERNLTWWEQTRLQTWWWLVATLVFTLAICFRKPLLSLVVGIVKKTP